tara:strand:- start:205 stop:702 length:498 start_codon:yes stop_codon:yes gene_type:complete
MNQKNTINTCNSENCDLEGLYRAPLNKMNLNIHQWFCLEHIKEFNKSWDFHKEMGADEIEIELKKDTTWRRPTKPFGSGSNSYNFNFNNRFKENSSKPNKNTNKLQWSLHMLNLTIKNSLVEIKNSYKKLVKIYHPDIKSDIKNSDEKFRNIVEAYEYLTEYYRK